MSCRRPGNRRRAARATPAWTARCRFQSTTDIGEGQTSRRIPVPLFNERVHRRRRRISLRSYGGLTGKRLDRAAGADPNGALLHARTAEMAAIRHSKPASCAPPRVSNPAGDACGRT